jgi:hypothetical protein
LRFNFKHPVFNIALLVTFIDIDWLDEIYFFLLCGDHAHNMVFFTENNLRNSFKTLVHVCLNQTWVFSLGQDLQEIVIGQEEESCKNNSLCLQEIVKLLLNLVKVSVVVFELLFNLFLLKQFDNTWLILNAHHDEFPMSINILEHLVFQWHSRRDIS